MLPPTSRRDAGDSLIEILMAIAIMGIAFAAILGGFATTVRGSDYHRKQADVGEILRNATEQINNAAFGSGCQGNGAANYTVSTGNSEIAVSVGIPDVWNSSVSPARYEIGGTAAAASTCSSTQLQRIKLSACLTSSLVGGACPAGGAGVETLTMAKRK